MKDKIDALTDKEKETLRLMLRGHDAKSMARTLDLSVHTVNDRLRAARRKLSVTSSKEAARLLLEEEGAAPQLLVHKPLGDAGGDAPAPERATENLRMSRTWIIGGFLVMSLILAIALVSQAPSPFAFDGSGDSAAVAQDRATEMAARNFLEMLDRGDWAASYAATTSKFRSQNTQQVWADVSQDVRPPLGALVSRSLLSNEWVPTPEGYVMVKYRSDFANRQGAVETVTMVKEDGAWKVSGVIID
jgi:DNA-binding CsgD family transcriptional regulator